MQWVGRLVGGALDFALPPCCPGCGEIVGDLDRFCKDCWPSLDFLAGRGCACCGRDGAGIDDGATCAACLASPPPIDRVQAALAYDALSRRIAIRLKHGRKVALARTMARYMAPLISDLPADALLVPVPLHRSRLWSRGFNQSLLVARALSRLGGWPVAPAALVRVKRTPPLKGMGTNERHRTVAGAFRAGRPLSLAGRTIVLVDDVLTTGSTAEACARVLRKAGAGRIELVCWARVAGPRRID